jgi:TonB family protein
MFDKLIESEPEGADFKNRRNYFMVSSLVVGALFVTAVVISIYAADFGLGHDSLELVEMIAPVQPAPVAPETPQPRTSTSQSREQMPTRPEIISRTDESQFVPTSTSSTPNIFRGRPRGPVGVGTDSGPDNSNGSGRETGTSSSGDGLASVAPVSENTTLPEPPAPPVKKAPVKSLGVINGNATYLPKPTYSAAALAIRAQGNVDVQVMIDETGKVISANAISGHVLLRRAAEQAARNARFTATLLSNVPVKVTGVIVYNFVR